MNKSTFWKELLIPKNIFFLFVQEEEGLYPSGITEGARRYLCVPFSLMPLDWCVIDRLQSLTIGISYNYLSIEHTDPDSPPALCPIRRTWIRVLPRRRLRWPSRHKLWIFFLKINGGPYPLCSINEILTEHIK